MNSLGGKTPRRRGLKLDGKTEKWASQITQSGRFSNMDNPKIKSERSIKTKTGHLKVSGLLK